MATRRQRLVSAGLWLLTVCSAGAPVSASGASDKPTDTQPAGYADMVRELRIGGDVLRSALADALPEDLRLVDVEAGYLADQGVLVIVDLARPWYRLDGTELEVDPEVLDLEHMPQMVQDILAELDVGLSRRQVGELAELRDIRDAQRSVRAEQRDLRARLRELGRDRLRSEGAAVVRLDTQIADLQARLAAAAAQQRRLEDDAGSVRRAFEAPLAGNGTQNAAADLDMAVAQTICGYGATFQSLEDGQRLNVVVRRGETSRYYVFAMAQVRGCREGAIDAAALVAASLRYGP